MVDSESNAHPLPEQPDDACFARWVGLQGIRLLVAPDPKVGAIEVRIEGMPGDHAVLLFDQLGAEPLHQNRRRDRAVAELA
jgi:hypothetical protein